MGKTVSEFCDYLNRMAGCSLYVLGGQGESLYSLAEDFISSMEKRYSQNPEKNTARIMTLLKKKLPEDLYFYDCSGLGVKWLLEQGLIKNDMTANSMYTQLCSKISKSDVRCGDWVFIRSSSTGNITHVGYVVDDDLNVVEAAGRDYGVIKRSLSKGSPNGAWNVFGRPNQVFDLSEEASGENNTEETAAISRVLRLKSPYMRGDDVKALQKALQKKGGALTADGIFGPATEEAAIDVQKQLFPGTPSEWDGQAGKKTVTALGLKWIG